MEKITDEDLKSMLVDYSKETQWEKVDLPSEEDNVLTEESEKSLQESLESEIDFNKIPDTFENTFDEKPLDIVLEKRDELTLGLTPEDIKDLYEYISGKGNKPLYIDRFTSDTEGRLKDMTLIMALIQLSQIPTLTAYRNQVQERLFDPKNLYDMDSKTLSATMTNLNKDIMNILEASIRAVQTISQFGALNNAYRKTLDELMLLPPDKLEMIHKLILENEEVHIEK